MKALSRLILAVVLVFPLSVRAQTAENFAHYEKACAETLAAAGKTDEAKRLKDFLAADWDYQMRDDPEWATYVGYPGVNRLWTDLSPEAVAKRVELNALALKVAKSFAREKLDAANRLNLDLFLYVTETAVQGDRFPEEYLQITQMDGIQQEAADLFVSMPQNTAKDYEDILARLEGMPERIDQTAAWLKEGLAKKITPPRITLRDVPDQIRNQIVTDALESPLLVPFKEFPKDFPEDKKTALTEKAKKLYLDGIAPAFRRLLDFVEKEYVPGARAEIALTSMPGGKEWYAHLARFHTTTSLTPQEIHDIGLKEVARIRGEMEKVKTAAGFSGTLAEFFDFMRKDKRFFFTDKNELLMTYRDIAKRADPELTRLFGRLPRLPYGIAPVPGYAEKSQTTAYYQPGSVATGRAGLFYANTYDLPSRPKWEMEALTLHEAVPGHHLQISIAKELDGLPDFRKEGDFTAYIEGWGLYSESLGGELGFYKDPYAKFGQLTYEMWRAIRLVVDTGMHALGWSREKAIAFFEENAGKAGHDIVVEVDRYIVWPGQALAYKIGELKFKELREAARTALGERFDVRAFHDKVLGEGPLPLDVLDGRVREWIAGQGALAASGN